MHVQDFACNNVASNVSVLSTYNNELGEAILDKLVVQFFSKSSIFSVLFSVSNSLKGP